MSIGRITSRIGLLGMLSTFAIAGCSDDSAGTDDPVDTSGACGLVCDGGEAAELGCAVGGFDPTDGLEACTRACQAEWPSEQDPDCSSDASFVLSCVNANQSCDTLDNDTCGVAETELVDCASAPIGAGGMGGGGPTIDVEVEAFSLSVRESCDAGGEGDFFISVRLRDDTGDEQVLIDDNRDNLVQASGGIVSLDDLDIIAAGTVPAVTGTRLIVSASVLENDPEGPQVSSGESRIYEYDASAPCWRLEDSDECLGPEGEIDVLIVRLVDNTGDPCDAQLRARFTAGPPQ